jgi:methionyl-tRNA formyltransferase
MKMSKKLVFFGSGPVAAKSLADLAADFSFEAVITKPKPAHHRGLTPVLDTAEEFKLPVLTAASKAELDELIDNHKFKAQAAILVDFGIIVSKNVIEAFPKGIINSHFSLLPQWRGADPITFAILSGQPKSGVSLMLIDEGLDTGKILVQKSIPISADDNTLTLTDKLIDLSSKLLKEYVPKYLDGALKPRAQPHPDRATYSRKLTKADGEVDWGKPAEEIEREIRAYAGWPKSRTRIFDNDVILTKARVAQGQDDGQLVMKCQPGWLEIKELIAPSGRTMSGEAFLRGYKK